MINYRPCWEARIATAEDQLRYEYRRAVDSVETLRRFNDDEVDWSPVAELQGQLRKLAEEITGQPSEVPA